MTELALPRTPPAGTPKVMVRFAGKRLKDLLDAVATGVASELRRDVDVVVVARDRHGMRIWGHARPGSMSSVPDATPSIDRVIESALDDGRQTRTSRLIGTPVRVDGRIMGAVMIHAARSRSLDATDWSQTLRAVSRWAVTVDNALAFATAMDRAANLEIALASRAVIEQAKGILMEREGCDSGQAFAVLRELSQRGDSKLAVVAAQIVADAPRSRADG
jgi:hypothetical protein